MAGCSGGTGKLKEWYYDMKVLTGKIEKAGGRVVVLGTFDGVHRGHRELIRQGRILAKELNVPLRVYSFDRHPLEVVRPELAPPLLDTPEEKKEKLEACGADELRVLTFDRKMADMAAEDFLTLLRQECDLLAAVAGWNYTFGRKGNGNAETLRLDGEKMGYKVIIVPPVRTAAGEIISSTAIREKLKAGDIAGAEEML